MQLGHDGIVGGHRLDGLGEQVLRMARHEANALHARLARKREDLSEARLTI